MDAYRKGNSITLWLKTPEEDFTITKEFRARIYLDPEGEGYLRRRGIPYQRVQRQTYLRTTRDVLEVEAPIAGFEHFVSQIEQGTKHRVGLFNADIKPEQMYLYASDLRPCGAVEVEDEHIIMLPEEHPVQLVTLRLKVIVHGDPRRKQDKPITKIFMNDAVLEGEEHHVLEEFSRKFRQIDPDIIVMDYGYSRLPYLADRLEKHGISCPLHRWDDAPITYRGGRSYWTYGQVRYQDYAVRLHGRFLLDTSTFVGTECDVDAVAELAYMSGTLFQQTASRSFGAAFQTALVREMIRRGYLVPYKEKPLEKPLSMFEMLKCDRAGHTMDPKVGFHRDVAEIDFTSMYPWLIYNHNISADSILSTQGPFSEVPDVPISTTLQFKGLIPAVLKPFIERRMYYKAHPTAVNKQRAQGLKWLLVSCYGYLRFREFKLGIPTSHMAICAYARETILRVVKLAEERGYEVVHAIIDSAYIKKKNITEAEVKEFCKEVEMVTGIPMSFEGVFKWAVFLPSIVDKDRPLPTSYYGAFRSGEVKARGIEVRQRSTPLVVKHFQQHVLEEMAKCSTKEEIKALIPELLKKLRETIEAIPQMDHRLLVVNMRVSKTEYTHTTPQKRIVERLKQNGIQVVAGQFIHFIYGRRGAVLPEEYNGKPDIAHYRKLLVRSLFTILQPFGYTRQDIEDGAEIERQTTLGDFLLVKHVYVQMRKEYEERSGLSERLIRQKLESEGWHVWRSDMMNVFRNGVVMYPNVQRKYARLLMVLSQTHAEKIEELQYINAVHHGLPDFICHRDGDVKFVECKLQYEQLSKVQKACIDRLRGMGFLVEVHKLVDHRTHIVTADVDVRTKRKYVSEAQLKIAQAV